MPTKLFGVDNQPTPTTMAHQQSPKRPPGPPPLPPKVKVAKSSSQEIEEDPESSPLHDEPTPPSNPADLTRVVEELLAQMVRSLSFLTFAAA